MFREVPEEFRLLTKFATVASIAALALGVLWRSPSDGRMAISIVVSLGALVLAVRSFLAGKFLGGLVFLGTLGVFTPFRSGQFSQTMASTLDLAALALFAVSPVMFRRNKTS